MTDQLQEGLAHLAAERKAHMASAVTYARGEDSVEIEATRARTIFRLPEDYGVEVRVVMRDYLITAADLILDESLVEPQDGDTITDAGKTYEIMGPNVDEPSWRYCDSTERTIRVHCKEIAT